MKKLSIVFVALFFTAFTFAQEVKTEKKEEKKVIVPQAVKTAFAAKFPKAAKIEWSLEKAGEYEAEFKLDKAEMSANFNEKGNLIETETEITESALPPSIKSAVAKEFAGYKIGEIAKVFAKGVTSYELEASKDKKTYEVEFDANGKMISKKEAKEEEKDKD
jgi:hypothetical protein